MAASDAKAFAVKNAALRVTVPIFDADGDLVSGATGLDSEVSKDGGNFADCTNEATEIQSTGMYYLDLTADEMNADTVVVIVKTSSSGAKTTPIVLYTTTATRGLAGTALPAAAADAAGGLPISDAGGLDLDAQIKTDIDDILTDTGTTLDDLVDDLETRLTADRAGYLDKLNVSGTLAHSDAAATYKADVSLLALESTLTAIKGAGWTTETLAAMDALIDAIKAKTDNLPASPAATGAAMTLADDAITSAKFDESTAFPLKSADTGATAVARTGADADTLETLSDQIDGVPTDADVQVAATASLNAYDPPTNAEMEARTLLAGSYFDPAADTVANVTAVGSVTGAVGSVTGNVGGNVVGSVASVSGAVGSVTGNVGGNVTGSIGSLATQAKADVNAEVVDALTVDIVADSIPADGTRPSIAQAAYMLVQFMLERAVSGTTVTVKKADGSTTLFALTLNDATSPTTITRSS